MIKGFLLDLDGVLTDTAEYHFQAWKKLGEEIGVSFGREFNDQLKGISRMESLERILEFGHKQDAYSEEEKKALASRKNEDYKKLIQNISKEDLLPGIPAFLNDLKEAGMRIALASSSKNGPTIIERLGITDLFDAVVNPEDIENGKPHPDIFLRAAALLGLRPEECVGVEDAAAGVEGINEAGSFSVGVGPVDSLKKADFIVPETQDLNVQKILAAAEKGKRR